MSTVEPDQDPSPREGLDLRPTGTAHLWLDGTQVRLRRPRAREFRALRESLQDALDELNDIADDHSAWLESLGTGHESWATEQRAEDRKRGREITARTEELMSTWVLEVVATLAVGQQTSVAAEADDLPPWLVQVGTVTQLLNHWRNIPSLSGVR